MGDDRPIIWWVRRDLRLADNPVLAALATTGRPVVPVFILDPETETLGAAAKWRFGLGLAAFDAALRGIGSRLILRRGDAGSVLAALVAEVGAEAVHWSRLYDPSARARDTAVKAGLKSRGTGAISYLGHLLHEPWSVQTGQGGFYRVFTPFWRSVRNRAPTAPEAAPKALRPPAVWPCSEDIRDWRMGAAMRRGAAVVSGHVRVGEDAARSRLADFMDSRLDDYAQARDYPGQAGTSGLSENLTYGEIGPRTIWHAGMRALHEGKAGAEPFLRQLAWREFSYHLLFHTPHIAHRNWRADWDGFAWRGDNYDAERWRQGRTGVQLVDAAMREMYVTGTMHNRGRMIVASFLTKHLLTDWRVGMKWFDDCLIDWDPAANAMGWQWAAGSGPDASPFFRIFNPDTQAAKFDRDASYRRRFIAELSDDPGEIARAYFDAVPEGWGLDPDAAYPKPMIALDQARLRALEAYSGRNC